MMSKIWLIPASVAVALIVFYYHQWQRWLAYATGSYNIPGVAHNYNAFSGSLSDVGQITLLFSVVAAFLLVWRSHTCHRYWWCWRHPLHPLEGTSYKLCVKHHPNDIPSVEEVIDKVTSHD